MWIPCAVLLSLVGTKPAEPVIQRSGVGLTESAVMVADAALGHTAQLVADAGLDVDGQLTNAFDKLAAILADHGSSRADLVKLNLYVADAETAKRGVAFLSNWSPADSRPAVAIVETELPEQAKFALDAVFVARREVADGKVTHHVEGARRGDDGQKASSKSRVSVLPRGDVVYVSGQAQPGDLAKATRATLNGLLDTLKFLKLRRADIVQIKCFLQPMSKVAVVDQELLNFFADAPVPAVSHVQWIAGGARPIEIELVVAAAETKTDRTVSYFTPPGLKPSGVFSRVARIHGNRRVYVAGLIARQAGTGEQQVHAIFQQLIRQLKPARANLRHLAKATYYVTDAEAGSQLNKIRPHYYDPRRPPAASKAMVRGTGFTDRTVSIDVIAAPEAPLNRVLTPIAARLQPTRKPVYKSVGARKLHLHIFEPKGHKAADRRPVFLAIHGGGWTGGNARSFYPFAARFAARGMLGISLEYRLRNDRNGTTVFDCVRDARSAVRWLRSNATKLGADPKRIVAMGGSAGGHLAVSTALFDNIDQADDDRSISARPDALILMYPVIDTSADGYGQAKIGNRWRQLSPVHNVRAGLPPALMFHGTADAVTPYLGARRFHDLSIAAGNSSELVTQPGGRHGYIIFDQAEYDAAISRMAAFLTHRRFLPVVP